MVSWFRNSRARYTGVVGPRHAHTLGHGSLEARVAAYEQLWREEEEALWDWLDERVGLPEDLAATVRTATGGRGESMGRANSGQKSMGQRELEHAIDVTEEKLRILRGSIKKSGNDGSSGRKGDEHDSTADAEVGDGRKEL